MTKSDAQSTTHLVAPPPYHYTGQQAKDDIPRDVEHIIVDTPKLPDGIFGDARPLLAAPPAAFFSNLLEDRFSALVRVDLPTGLGCIPTKAFSSCTSLTTVHLPSTLQKIGEKAFFNCHSLQEMILPESLLEIGDSAFFSCIDLHTVHIPTFVTDIGTNAFSGCRSLSSPIHLPKGVTILSAGIFHRCRKLQQVTAQGPIVQIEAQAFAGCTSLSKFALPNAQLQRIGHSAFSCCYNLPNVDFLFGVEEIHQYTFTYCHSLTSISLPSTVTRIGNYAFDHCATLNTVVLSFEGNLKTIGKSAFLECHKLNTMQVPESVVTIGKSAFQGCPLSEEGYRNRFQDFPVHELCYRYTADTINDNGKINCEREKRQPFDQEFCRIAQDNGDELMKKDKFGMNPIHILANSKHTNRNLLHILTSKCPSNVLLEKDSWERLPIHYSCLAGCSQVDVLDVLCTPFKDDNSSPTFTHQILYAKDKDGMLPVCYAAERRNPEIVEHLMLSRMGLGFWKCSIEKQVTEFDFDGEKLGNLQQKVKTLVEEYQRKESACLLQLAFMSTTKVALPKGVVKDYIFPFL